jgi:tetratricopeptide (TPR) repeat protein
VHRHIAQAMRDRLPVLAEQQPELLALHLEEGGDLEGAVVQWRQAGDRSFRRAAYAEAARQLERALSVQRRLPPGTEQLQNERLRVEIETLIMLGTVLLSTRGHADPEVRDRFSRARALCEASGVEVSLKILVNLVAASIMEGSRAATETFLPRLERLAEESGDTVSRLSGLTPLALYAFWRGEHARAAELLARAHALYRTEDFRRYAEDYGWDGGIYANAYAVWNRWLTGDVAGAEETYTQLLAAAESSFDPQALPIALLFGMACAHGRRDVGIASARAERLMAIAAEQRLYFYLTIGQCGHAFAQAKLGQRDEGIAALRSSLATLQLMGTRTIYGYYLTYLAEALLDAGDVDGGLAVVAEGLALCAQDLGRVHEPELLRLEGELLDARGDGAAAEERLRRAHDQARAGGALVWQLRSALGLARRLARRGKVSSVRDLLAPVCERFRVGETFPDLEAARAALASACATDDRSR